MRRAAVLPLLMLCAQAPAPDHTPLDQLYDALRQAPDEAIAGRIEEQIRARWLSQATPATALLFTRGLHEMQNDATPDAIDDFSAAIDLQPDFAEAFTERARARFAEGDYAGAVEDIGASLGADPRQFDALDALSRFAESRNDWKGAYSAWRKLMEIDPRTPGGVDRLNDLRRRALGENA